MPNVHRVPLFSKGKTVTESTVSTATARAANKAGQKVLDAVEAVSTAAPQVVETSEVAASIVVPSKVILKQPLIVGVSVLAGAGLGAGILWGVQKIRTRNKLVVTVDKPADLDEKTEADTSK